MLLSLSVTQVTFNNSENLQEISVEYCCGVIGCIAFYNLQPFAITNMS